MEIPEFEALNWLTVGNTLLDKARNILNNAHSDQLRLLTGRIPSSIVPPDKAIEVVFAGQYGAGKSTILKQLTGRDDISIGAGISTQSAHTYDWNGIKVTDTPGIHTKIRPDHDEVSYRAIAEADLLVFVITNELFDSELAQHFRKLAIERDKAHEMMLVVNKMRRCSNGNSPEAQETIREDLRRVLLPFSPEDLRTSFIDAEAAIDSMSESDEHIRVALWKKSGFEFFVENLNDFIRSNGLTGRYSTALYSLEQVLQEALAQESTGDADVDSLEELLLQRRRAILETQERIPRAAANEIQKISSKIREEGRRASELIHGSADQEAVNREIQAAQNRVQQYSEELSKSIQNVIGTQIANLDERLGEILDSELAKELIPRLIHRIEDQDISIEAISNMKTISNIASQLGTFLIKNSFKAESGTLAGLSKLSEYSGTPIHKAVLEVGHFFGKSFKPWEAVKWTRGIAHAGRVLAVAGTVLTFILQIKDDCDATQLENDLRESRSTIRNGFNDAAHVIEMHYDEATKTYVASILTTDLELIDQQLEEIRNMQQQKSNTYNNLISLLKETRELILMLH